MSKPRRKLQPFIQKKQLPAPVQLKRMQEYVRNITSQQARMARLLWVCVHQAGGRVEIDPGDYNMAMQMQNDDCTVNLHVDAEAKKICLILKDGEGKTLPESEKKLIITL